MSLLVRDICLREEIEILHAHQNTSLLGIITSFTAKSFEIPFVYTQHSLHDFEDVACIELNNLYSRLAKYNIAHVICVSNTVKENFLLRTGISPDRTSVIPNAIDHAFYSQRQLDLPKDPTRVKIIVFTRMTFRKGIDFLLEVLPIICKEYKNVKFLLCGDGPKRSIIEHLVSDYSLESQVEFKGFANIEEVPLIHSSGDIFLNTSISEAFCLAILEAAACGLHVISTNVGGISEILPSDAVTLCQPTPDSILENLRTLIDNKIYLNKTNSRPIIEQSYDWNIVAKDTVKIYTHVIANAKRENYCLLAWRMLTEDFCYFLLLFPIMFNVVVAFFVDWIYPAVGPRRSVDLPRDAQNKLKHS
jgi:phosphatidylinositol glycan class A protein